MKSQNVNPCVRIGIFIGFLIFSVYCMAATELLVGTSLIGVLGVAVLFGVVHSLLFVSFNLPQNKNFSAGINSNLPTAAIPIKMLIAFPALIFCYILIGLIIRYAIS